MGTLRPGTQAHRATPGDARASPDLRQHVSELTRGRQEVEVLSASALGRVEALRGLRRAGFGSSGASAQASWEWRWLPWALKSSHPILTRVFMPLPCWATPPQEHCQMDQRATSVAP